jgi:hypothetical protein
MFNFFKRKEVEVAPVIKVKRVKKQWRPKTDSFGVYWFVADTIGVQSCEWVGDAIDSYRMRAGNMFKTRKEARVMCDRVKRLFKK